MASPPVRFIPRGTGQSAVARCHRPIPTAKNGPNLSANGTRPVVLKRRNPLPRKPCAALITTVCSRLVDKSNVMQSRIVVDGWVLPEPHKIFNSGASTASPCYLDRLPTRVIFVSFEQGLRKPDFDAYLSTTFGSLSTAVANAYAKNCAFLRDGTAGNCYGYIAGPWDARLGWAYASR